MITGALNLIADLIDKFLHADFWSWDIDLDDLEEDEYP